MAWCDQQVWWISWSDRISEVMLSLLAAKINECQSNKNKIWTKVARLFFIFFSTNLCRLVKAEHAGLAINKGCMRGKVEQVRGGDEGGNRSHKVKIKCLYPRGSSWAERAAGGVKKREKKWRHWTLTFLPSRKLRAVPMLATQWILFSFLPCSHGWEEWGDQDGDWKKEIEKMRRK